MVELLGDKVQLSIVYYNDEPLSATLYHCYKKGILYYANAQSTEHKYLAPNNLNKWSMMEWGHKNGYLFMDIGNYYEKQYKLIDEKGYNVGKYKSSFGKDYVVPFYGYKEYNK